MFCERDRGRVERLAERDRDGPAADRRVGDRRRGDVGQGERDRARRRPGPCRLPTTTGSPAGLWIEKRVSCRWPGCPAGLVKLIGNWMIVGSVGLSTAIGVPTLTVTPVGTDVKVRSAAETVEKLTGLLKVTVMALGVDGDGRAVGRVGRGDAQEVDRVDGVDGVDQAVAGLRVPGARRRAVHRRLAPSRSGPRGSRRE